MRLCTVSGCEKKHYAKGYCNKHYQRVCSSGTADDRKRILTCTVSGCGKSHKSNGLCLMHYTRMIRHGDLDRVSVIRGDDKKRMINSVDIDDSGCWNWIKSINMGYGVTSLRGKREQAHRASWMVFVGEIPNGMQINHKCHNKMCINPDHLYVGTQKENMRDMEDAGRAVRCVGGRNGNSKLSEMDVLEVKKMIMDGKKNDEISLKFSVSRSTIQFIRIGKTWGHVVLHFCGEVNG